MLKITLNWYQGFLSRKKYEIVKEIISIATFFFVADTQYVNVIDSAIKQFEDYTCLRWVPRGSTEDTASYNSYIEFFSERYIGLYKTYRNYNNVFT